MHKQPPKQTVTVSALLGLFLVLLGASPALAQETISLSPGQAEKIETIVQKEMQEARIPGLSLAIVAKKQLVYARGFGLADREASTPATAETVYRTASLAKPITATAAMQLWEQGKLDLDAPIQRYCPVFPEKKSPISTRQLLGHLSGIRHNKKKGSEQHETLRNHQAGADAVSAGQIAAPTRQEIFLLHPWVHSGRVRN